MFVFEIKLEIKNPDNKNEIIDLLWSYVAELSHNGQILNSIELFKENDDQILITVICPEINSLSENFSSEYLLEYSKQIEEIAETKIQIEFSGKDTEDDEIDFDNCCHSAPYYILFTSYFRINSPVKCGKCFKSVPLYRISGTGNLGILSWKENYKACDWLQLGSTVGEKFGLNELSNFDSNLTKEGLEICNKLEEITKKPIFYYLFNYRNISHKKDSNRKCPSCQGDWLLENELHNMFNFKCENCKIISNFTCNPA